MVWGFFLQLRFFNSKTSFGVGDVESVKPFKDAHGTYINSTTTTTIKIATTTTSNNNHRNHHLRQRRRSVLKVGRPKCVKGSEGRDVIVSSVPMAQSPIRRFGSFNHTLSQTLYEFCEVLIK